MAGPGVKLDHCVLHVSDWERSNAFYRDVLGAELVPVGARWAYRFGGQQLNLHGPGSRPCRSQRYPPCRPVGATCASSGRAPSSRRPNTCGVEVESGPVERFGEGGGQVLPRPRRLAARVHLLLGLKGAS